MMVNENKQINNDRMALTLAFTRLGYAPRRRSSQGEDEVGPLWPGHRPHKCLLTSLPYTLCLLPIEINKIKSQKF